MWFDIRGDVLNGSSLLNPFRKGNIKRAPLLRKTDMYVLLLAKVLGKVWPGFKNKYDLDIYDLR